MDPATLGLIAFVCLLLLLAMRVPIGFALLGVATIATFSYFALRGGSFTPERAIRPTLGLLYSNGYDLIHNYSLAMIPLFVAMGNIAYRAGITSDIYNAARIWLTRVPGGVAMASVIGCGGFSAITGSSVACASTMGRLCVPEMLRMGYDPRLATGSVAMGGTLGSLIPPSILFIIYSIFTETSVSKLFLGGVIPGFLTLAGFLLVIWVWSVRNPQAAPGLAETPTVKDRLDAAVKAWPAILLFLIIVGGIYGGLFTAVEAAAVAMVATIVLAFMRRSLSLGELYEALLETCTQSSAIFIIAMGAKIFVAFTALTGLAPALAEWVASMDLQFWALMAMICVIYLVLGMFLDPIGILVLTLPLIVPMIDARGLDLIWFGVVVVKLLEIGLITPPVGLNVFVISSVTGSAVRLEQIFAGVLRFFFVDIGVLIIIIAFPALSLFLSKGI